VRQAGVQPIADGRPGLCVEAEQLLVPVPHSIRRQRPLAVVFEWDGPRAHLRPYLEAAACTGFISSFGACRGRHRWRSTRSYRGKLARRISGDHLALGRFCDQFLNALDGLYKGRIIAQTAFESATSDTPLAWDTLVVLRAQPPGRERARRGLRYLPQFILPPWIETAVRERSELVDVDVARAAGTAPVCRWRCT
jgi:hypothetical protein